MFLTLVTHRRLPHLVNPNVRLAFSRAVEHVRVAHPLQTIAFAVMPDHCHLLWMLPVDDPDFSVRVRLIKHYVSRQERLPHPIWQPRFWDHLIRDESDFCRHLDYIHFNPVKHGLVRSALEWRDSSFSRWVERGCYPTDWGSTVVGDGQNYGE